MISTRIRAALTALPSTLGRQLPSLTTLDLTLCKGITTLPDTIGEMGNLQVSSNAAFPTNHHFTSHHFTSLHFPSLPVTSRHLPWQTLFLGNCYNILQLPPTITKLRSLVTLNLYNCGGLRYLPDTFDEFVSLQVLSLQGCEKLVEVPESMSRLMTLSTLTLWNCQVGGTSAPQANRPLPLVSSSPFARAHRIAPHNQALPQWLHRECTYAYMHTCMQSQRVPDGFIGARAHPRFVGDPQAANRRRPRTARRLGARAAQEASRGCQIGQQQGRRKTGEDERVASDQKGACHGRHGSFSARAGDDARGARGTQQPRQGSKHIHGRRHRAPKRRGRCWRAPSRGSGRGRLTVSESKIRMDSREPVIVGAGVLA